MNRFLATLFLVSMCITIAVLLVVYFWTGDLSKESALCDRQVEALLHSKDPVEIERAGIIIRRAHCRLNTRLKDEP